MNNTFSVPIINLHNYIITGSYQSILFLSLLLYFTKMKKNKEKMHAFLKGKIKTFRPSRHFITHRHCCPVFMDLKCHR